RSTLHRCCSSFLVRSTTLFTTPSSPHPLHHTLFTTPCSPHPVRHTLFDTARRVVPHRRCARSSRATSRVAHSGLDEYQGRGPTALTRHVPWMTATCALCWARSCLSAPASPWPTSIRPGPSPDRTSRGFLPMRTLPPAPSDRSGTKFSVTGLLQHRKPPDKCPRSRYACESAGADARAYDGASAWDISP